MNGRAFTIITSTINMVGKLKEEIEAQEKIPVEHQNLFFNVSYKLVKIDVKSMGLF